MRLSQAAESVQGALIGEDRAFAGCSTDSRGVLPGALFVAIRGERYDGHDFIDAAAQAGAAGAMVERAPGAAAIPLLKVDRTREAMGRLASAWRCNFRFPVIAVTGSNGKTTVKEMLASILGRNAAVIATRGNLNNDIGVPLTLFGFDRQHRCAVIEIGANHPGEIAGLTRIVKPDVAVITQCAPAHLEGFGSIESVARAKAEIFEGLPANGTAVINADDDYAGLWRDGTAGVRRLSFGMRNPADVSAADVQMDPDRGEVRFLLRAPTGETPVRLHLFGRHNIANALAAAACAVAVEASLDDIRAGLEAMVPVKGRLQLKRARADARLLDDTYNANPASLKAALDVLVAFPGRHWLVLGDMGELGAGSADLHREAGRYARESGVERVWALGPLCTGAVDAFGAGAQHFDSADALAAALAAALEAGVTVLVKGSRSMRMERIVEAVEEAG